MRRGDGRGLGRRHRSCASPCVGTPDRTGASKGGDNATAGDRIIRLVRPSRPRRADGRVDRARRTPTARESRRARDLDHGPSHRRPGGPRGRDLQIRRCASNPDAIPGGDRHRMRDAVRHCSARHGTIGDCRLHHGLQAGTAVDACWRLGVPCCRLNPRRSRHRCRHRRRHHRRGHHGSNRYRRSRHRRRPDGSSHRRRRHNRCRNDRRRHNRRRHNRRGHDRSGRRGERRGCGRCRGRVGRPDWVHPGLSPQRQECGRVDVALVVVGVADPQVNVRAAHLRVAARTDRPRRRSPVNRSTVRKNEWQSGGAALSILGVVGGKSVRFGAGLYPCCTRREPLPRFTKIGSWNSVVRAASGLDPFRLD